MNLHDAAWQLSEFLENNRAVYVKTEPEVPDFTTSLPFKIVIWGTKSKVELEATASNLTFLIGLFDSTIFSKDCVDRLYVWNLKSLLSYVKAVTGKFVSPAVPIIDLKIIENFLNIRKNVPENLIEAVNRTKLAVADKSWRQFQNLYKAIHLPLALRVLPSIETNPLLNEETRQRVYPYYEIEGQINGRMNCMKKFVKCYLPHNMGPDVRKVLKPLGYGMRFLCSDFRHCEVTVLQWLSGDLNLKQILDSGADLHERIYEIITGDPCNSEKKRAYSKQMFLPVMFGCGAVGLGKALGVNENIGAELIARIKYHFRTAWDWMYARQEEAKKAGIAFDYFGRPRTFTSDDAYHARDFAIQGVAATACQEKLIELNAALDSEKASVVFSVHDGFGLVIAIEHAKETYKLVKSICESESKLCPGLQMKVKIKFGAKLDAMKELWRN